MCIRDSFDDLPLSCAMLVLASQSMLELMQNDDIFRLPTPVISMAILTS